MTERHLVFHLSQSNVSEDVFRRKDNPKIKYVRQETNVDGQVIWLSCVKDNMSCPSLTFGGYEANCPIKAGIKFITPLGTEITTEGGWAKKTFPFSWEKTGG